MYPESVNPKLFIPIFKNRVIDCFKQEWTADISRNLTLSHLYIHLKHDIKLKTYLEVVCQSSLKSLIAKVRISAHTLRIERDRYGKNKIPRNERICT